MQDRCEWRRVMKVAEYFITLSPLRCTVKGEIILLHNCHVQKLTNSLILSLLFLILLISIQLFGVRFF